MEPAALPLRRSCRWPRTRRHSRGPPDGTDGGGRHRRHERRHHPPAAPGTSLRPGADRHDDRRDDETRHFVTFFGNWPLFLAIVASVIAMSTLSGFVMSRLKILPGTTAIWGPSAGAASMLVMADAYGADIRLVAFMQYLRVVFVAAAASLVARYWAEVDAAGPGNIGSGRSIAPIPRNACRCRCRRLSRQVAARAGRRLPRAFLVGSVLSVTGMLTIEIPEWLLAISYAMLGWNFGSVYPSDPRSRPPRAAADNPLHLVLMSFSGLLAFTLVETVGIDPLTAYLATSPAAWIRSPLSPLPARWTYPSSWRCRRRGCCSSWPSARRSHVSSLQRPHAAMSFSERRE